MPENASLLDRTHLDQIADKLAETGWVALAGFIDPSLVELLRDDAETKFQSGKFREARIGRGSDLKTEKRIRSDEILWFEPDTLSPAQSRLWSLLEKVREGLNERLFLGLRDFEAHYARYAPGASYGKHVDRFSSDDARTISVVLYLNESWTPADGGELALYPEGSERILIEPRGGTLVCFLSAELEHEVLTSQNQPRKSIAAWFRKQKSPLR